MGVSERKIKEKQIRKNDIVQAAEKVFFTKGYDVATMDDVAKEAEFSKRTLYIYFNSKEQLYFEIMVRGYKILIEMLEADLSNLKAINALDRLKQIGKSFYRFHEEYPDYFNAIMSYENGEKDFTNGVPDDSREACYALGEKIFEYLASSIAKGIEEGVIRRELDVKSTTLVLWSCTIGLFNTLLLKRKYIEHYHERNPEMLISEGFDMLLLSIEARK